MIAAILFSVLTTSPVLATVQTPNESLWSGEYTLVSGMNCQSYVLVFFSQNSKLMTVKMDETLPSEDISQPGKLFYIYAKFDGKKYKEKEQWTTYYHMTQFESSENSENINFKKARATSNVEKKWQISESLSVDHAGLLHVKMDYKIDIPSYECLYQKSSN